MHSFLGGHRQACRPSIERGVNDELSTRRDSRARSLAGPRASQTLADLGAEVIKVERPGKGDDTRSWGPPYATDLTGKSTSDSAYFLSTNRGKKSVAIDITDPQGQNAIRELARTSDILIENFKVGGLAKYGLDYAKLA